jgi:hypothetical protein
MTTPSSNSGAGGLWQNPAYAVVNSTSLFVPNQQASTFAGVGFQPVPQPGVPVVVLGGAGPQAALDVVQVSAFSAYEVAMNFSVGSPVVSGQIMQVDIYWWDQLGDAVPVDHVRWEIPVSAVNGLLNGINSWGHGPMAGQWMAITIQNQTATGFPNGTFSFTGTTRNYTNHDWRSDGGLSNVTGSSAMPYTNELCVMTAQNIPATTGSAQRTVFLYSGQALFHSANLQGNGALQAVIQDSAGHEIVQLHPPENGAQDELIELPRRLCQIIVTNTGGAATTANVALIADRP